MANSEHRGAEGVFIGTRAQVGRFSYDVDEDRWWWSETMFRIHGFAPGEVPASTGVLLAHKHPEDAEHVDRVLRRAIESGEPFSCYHRIVDAAGKTRHVVAAGDAARRSDGTVHELRGYFIDMTEARRADVQREAASAVLGATEHRAVIDQAKGVLMFVYGIDQDAAFALLCARSQAHNVKVRELAERIMCSARVEQTHMPLAQRHLTRVIENASLTG